MRIISGLFVIMLILLTGCGENDATGGNATNVSALKNFSLVIQCGDTPELPIRITGDAHVAIPDFMRSNCSLHGNSEQITIRCPQDFSVLDGEGYSSKRIGLSANAEFPSRDFRMQPSGSFLPCIGFGVDLRMNIPVWGRGP